VVIDLQADAWDELGRQFLLLRVRTGQRTSDGQMLLSLFVWDGRTAQSGRFPPFGQLVQLPGYHLAGMAGVLAALRRRGYRCLVIITSRRSAVLRPMTPAMMRERMPRS
jgi:hypothetical protein